VRALHAQEAHVSHPTKGGTVSRLHDLVLTQHKLEAHVTITFLGNKEDLHESTVKQIESELNEHLAGALERRGFSVLSVDDFVVEIA
jgi:hypothetical protein